MRKYTLPTTILLLTLTSLLSAQDVKEKVLQGPNNVTIKVCMEGPYSAQTDLQIVCYFKYTAEGDKKMSGAPVELDKHLGGVIASLRERGEFVGDDMETILITPPKGAIPAKALLLIGIGDEATLSLEKMERVGRVALREASRLGAKKVAFAPLIRDQGNSTFSTGDVARSVVKGAMLAYDTEKRMHREKLASTYTLEQWSEEAGPAFYDETYASVQRALNESTTLIGQRTTKNYGSARRD
jgi:hypothetical protein